MLNITNRDAVLKCFEDIVATYGDVYALVNNAGVVDTRPFEENDEAILDKMFKVNVYGTTYCMQGALPSMKKNKQGKIINFASKSGKTGSALMGPYSAAKGAVIVLTQALAFEYANDNPQHQRHLPGHYGRDGRLVLRQQGLCGKHEDGARRDREEVHRQGTARPFDGHSGRGGIRLFPHRVRGLLHGSGV